jgi:uncharacterized protein (TIGR02145 family)
MIGTRCWFAENLRTNKRPDGSTITEGDGMYSNPAGYGSPWGRLYDWYEAMQGGPGASGDGAKIRGICPAGWHIPSGYGSSDDFYILGTFLGGESVAGGKMKQTGTTYWLSPNTGASNSSGFSGVGAGFNYEGDSFVDRLYYTGFWASPDEDENYGLGFELDYNDSVLHDYEFMVEQGLSIRCVKN